MDLIFSEISNLYDLELYDDLILLLEVCALDLLQLNKQQSAVIAAMAGDSYFQCENYATSQQAYYRALQILKSLSAPLSDPKFSEVELKYRLYRCLVKQSKREEAMGVLGSIAEHEMTPKIKAALAQLHSVIDVREQKNISGQSTSNVLLFHKRVVEDCPSALRSLSFVLRDGVRIESSGKWPVSAEAWIEAQQAVYERDYPKAISILNRVSNNNVRIIAEIGRLYYAYGERQKAANYLQRAHSMDVTFSSSMDILAYILAQDQKQKELESLGANLMRASESPEAWIAYGFLSKLQSKHDSALFFAHKACMMSESQVNSMAMLLKALVFLEKKKYDEAVKHLREALVFDPLNYDLYETLVQAFTEQRRPNEARLTAHNCRHHLGQEDPRALYLCAKIAAKNDVMMNEAQTQLEKAVSLSPHLLDAVFLLVELYDRTKSYDKAIALLKKQTEITVDSRLHRLLGDFLAKSSQLEAACDQYNLVGTLDPKSIASAMNSLEGLMGLNTPDTKLPTSSCPAAPRRRGAHSDALATQRNS